jgi:hypothetical protein
VADLEDAVFRLVEGVGDVIGSGVGERGWNLVLAFDIVAQYGASDSDVARGIEVSCCFA